MGLIVHENNASNTNHERYKLDDIATAANIGINTLRYHIKKMKKLFLNVPRDRFNRYLFNKDQRKLLLQVHDLKRKGHPYAEIFQLLSHNSTSRRDFIDCEESIREQCSTHPENLSARLEQLEQYKKTTNKINKVLCENNRQLTEIVAEQNAKIASLEERVALLIDLHTESLLKKGFRSADTD